MTFRWLICFNFALVLLLALPSVRAATIAGKVILRDSQVPAVKKSLDYSGVVISFIPVPPVSFPPPARHAMMEQKNKTFLPHVLPVLAGTQIDFPNYDPIFHNAFSNYSGQTFDVGLYPPGTKRTVRFSRPGVVRVFCNIHAAMSAVIVVLETPYFATSAKDGSWEVDLPPGEYEMHVYHERTADAKLNALTRKVTINGAGQGAGQNVGAITVSEAGYLPTPHANKFGRPYPEGATDTYYPGARK